MSQPITDLRQLFAPPPPPTKRPHGPPSTPSVSSEASHRGRDLSVHEPQPYDPVSSTTYTTLQQLSRMQSSAQEQARRAVRTAHSDTSSAVGSRLDVDDVDEVDDAEVDEDGAVADGGYASEELHGVDDEDEPVEAGAADKDHVDEARGGAGGYPFAMPAKGVSMRALKKRRERDRTPMVLLQLDPFEAQ